MAQQSKPAQAWSSRVALLRDASTREIEFAELLATVDPRWHGALDAAIYGGGELGVRPAESTLVPGVGLRIRRSKSGFSMDLTRRQSSLGSVTVARARPMLPSAPMALSDMLHIMFEDGEVLAPGAGSGAWDEVVGAFRSYAAQDAAKAGLLDSVDAALRERCEIYDNGHAFGIIRVGDTEDDREGIWISQVSDGWTFVHRVESPEDGIRILGEAIAGAGNAAATLNGFLEDIVSRMPAPELSAQDAYRELLRAHVAPALRGGGYKGSCGRFRRAAGEYEVLLQFQKSRFSTRARVDYRLNISVVHRATAELLQQANDEARSQGRHLGSRPRADMYAATLPPSMASGRHWFSLRPDEDPTAHAAMLLADIYSIAFPAIEAQLRLPLSGVPCARTSPTRPTTYTDAAGR